MGSLVTVHNDGPDALQMRIGGRWLVLQPNESSRFNATVSVEFEAMPKIDPQELASHLGVVPGTEPKPPCKLANDE